ncbi:hypothetical protein SSYM_2192 [Serratia symbiotica str. Tucson]|uniref:Uncharacterized protein n=1 Tax=Serratia symbiotica str. Tucson TaxID=914128 RepID=E9CNY7_9GAMM|nr:hypothetical protein SSYM_2192 [Serratia symbiotica str. Tucson]
MIYTNNPSIKHKAGLRNFAEERVDILIALKIRALRHTG